MLKPKFVFSKKALFLSENNFPATIIKYSSIFFACFIFISEISNAQHLNNLENRILVNLSENRTKGTTKFMQFISNSTSTISLGIPSVVLLKGIITNDKAEKQRGWYMLETFAANAAETYILKYAINRKRPYEVNPKIIKASSGGSPSFPSGHSSEAFAAATSLSLVYPKWYVIVPAFTWAGTVGFSRIYLGVHYPSDVLAGAILGSGTAWVMYKLNKRLQSGKKKKTSVANHPFILE